MVKEVLEMYEEKLTCFPGDVYCSPQGKVAGLKPDCHCVCNPGWTGEACHEAAEGNSGLPALTPLAECLVNNAWRSPEQAASMPEEDQRNTVIVELNNKGIGSVPALQGMNNNDLVSRCAGYTALSQCLVKNSWRSTAQVGGMSEDDQRNTVIVELNNRGVGSVPALQGMSNAQLVDKCVGCEDVGGSWKDASGSVTVMVTSSSWTCGGGAQSGAWTYTVSGSTVTLSDGTQGTLAGSAPSRTITWTNGVVYTEQGR
jgi:hypothetical protein